MKFRNCVFLIALVLMLAAFLPTSAQQTYRSNGTVYTSSTWNTSGMARGLFSYSGTIGTAGSYAYTTPVLNTSTNTWSLTVINSANPTNTTTTINTGDSTSTNQIAFSAPSYRVIVYNLNTTGTLTVTIGNGTGVTLDPAAGTGIPVWNYVSADVAALILKIKGTAGALYRVFVTQ
jgi:hypothetical protein